MLQWKQSARPWNQFCSRQRGKQFSTAFSSSGTPLSVSPLPSTPSPAAAGSSLLWGRPALNPQLAGASHPKLANSWWRWLEWRVQKKFGQGLVEKRFWEKKIRLWRNHVARCVKVSYRFDYLTCQKKGLVLDLDIKAVFTLLCVLGFGTAFIFKR